MGDPEFKVPGIFDRLFQWSSLGQTRVELLNQRRRTSQGYGAIGANPEAAAAAYSQVSSEVAPSGPVLVAIKGDGDSFAQANQRAGICARGLARKYYRLTIAFRLISLICGIVTAVTLSHESLTSIIMITAGTIAGMLDFVFGWGPLSEKYAELAVNFRRLASSTEFDRDAKFEELKIMLESAILNYDVEDSKET